MSNFPNLTTLVHTLAFDNEFTEKAEEDWAWPNNAEQLEQVASTLTGSQQVELAAGERSQMTAMVANRPELEPLHEFLEMVFDGECTSHFYEEFGSAYTCDQCQLVSIQGVVCHEQGCPKDWVDPETGEGYSVECGWCGERFAPYRKDETCCSDDCYSHFNYFPFPFNMVIP